MIQKFDRSGFLPVDRTDGRRRIADRPSPFLSKSSNTVLAATVLCTTITIAMQLTCVANNHIVCSDNDYLASLLHIPICEQPLSARGRDLRSSGLCLCRRAEQDHESKAKLAAVRPMIR